MPMRLQALGQWLQQHGITIDKASRHFCARKPGHRMYPIPAHNGMRSEISDVYLKKLCKHFGIDPNTLPI